ncbi:sulfate permease, SulP family [Polaribacter sp. Hel1_33_78]|jgi:SulP family sulfate permease|uniref:SulP family inorganic anion transporter n=1 Tax=unclassified Polaribacter TaxID=196858 RepID=UPI00052E3455|nr:MULTISPECIES: SulP family inorganic anion transporter [unclassified Polaribacter]MBT3741544.1 SulP family inorganic anion transporter [Polaribacter sp.]KGL59737.1 sulfate permease (SulP) [Polaribacter sp. Hel1_33_49]MBT4412561.1 SulP family inorganic anion transporter [Polaribacter sp.]PKV64231.1 SulP family sulfate permease [Polaribacter sp. Hel1_33_96]SDU17493.1 sulfate permease, SulP family [Polaribacter sp. Hel1_33_78]
MTKFITKRVTNVRNDILSGITVALALVPEAVAFAFVAGVDPLVGLYAAFMVGLITSLFGGRPGMISGATGALAVVMVSLVAEGNAMGNADENLGLYYLFLTVILMGTIQVLAGVLKLGKFVRLIPHSVMMGFVNGLAIVIFLSQLGMFKQTINDEKVWLEGNGLLYMIGLVSLTMLIMWGLPKIKATKKLPEALIAILVVSGIVIFSNLDVATVGSFIKDGGGEGLKGGFPVPVFETFKNIPMNFETLKFIFPYALILAAIGLIESLMTLNLIDDLTETRGNTNRECVAQGGANIITGLFGGMGGCAMIGQSIINIKGGGRGRLSGITASVFLLMFILFASSYIEQVPIAALVGVMFMVVIGTFAWSSFRIINKIPKSDVFVLILVSALTVIFDLAIAVIAGVIVSALVFAWESARKIRARKRFKEDGTKVYEIWGPLFFGSIATFNEKFDIKNDPNEVEIDFIEARVSDHSAIEAIFALVEKYQAASKKITLKHLSEDCKVLLYKASPIFTDIIEEDIDDPRYHLAANPEDFPKPLSEYKF